MLIPDDMKLFILVLVHKNLEQVKRLIRKLEFQNVKIYIHLDSKYKISEEDVKSLEEYFKVVILPFRYSINIIDCSVTKCILASLQYIVDDNKQEDYGYVALLSGQDYLIKPISSLYNYLQVEYPQPFIDCTPYSVDNWIYNKFCHSSFFGKNYGEAYKRNNLLGKIGRRVITLIDKLILKFTPDMYNRIKNKYGIDLFGGSQWWILPMGMIKEIINISKNYPSMIKDLFNCIPDEIFFQTIAMQTSQRHLIKINSKDMVAQNSLTYANFTPPNQKFMGHPYTIMSDDFHWLMMKPHFIARKFDMSVDSKIFDLIDRDHMNQE